MGQAWRLWNVRGFSPFFFVNISTVFRWEKGLATGDEKIATENLRRFFEQHFHESNDSLVHPNRNRSWTDYTSDFSGVRQHALLNLVRMHYLRDEITAAHDVRSTICTPFFDLSLEVAVIWSDHRCSHKWGQSNPTTLHQVKSSPNLVKPFPYLVLACCIDYLRQSLREGLSLTRSNQIFILLKSCLMSKSFWMSKMLFAFSSSFYRDIKSI